MESLHRKDNQPLKDVAGKPMACTVEVSEQKGNVDPQSSTFQFDKQPSSPIQMDLADEVGVSTDEVGVSVNEVEHQVHVTAEIDHTIRNQQQMEHVSELQSTDENTHVDTETNEPKKDDEADQAPQDINEVKMNEGGDDTVQRNIHQFVPDTITVDTSDSSTSTTISPATQAAIDALISDLEKVSIPVKPLSVFDPQDLTGSHDLLPDSQLPTDISITEIIVRSDSKTPVPRNKLP